MNEATLVLMPSVELLRPQLAEDCHVVGWEDGSVAGELARARAIVVAGHEPLPHGLFEACPRLGLIACFTGVPCSTSSIPSPRRRKDGKASRTPY